MPETEPSPDELAADLALIRDAAAEAAAIALGFFKQSPEVWMKAGASPVSEADYAVDRFLRDALTQARPDYGWLSEETADSAARLSSERTFVVDPIDGTRAFLEGRPTWCVSIAVVEAGRPLVGVLDCPAKGEIYAGLRGAGATRNGEPLAVSQRDRPVIGGPKAMIDTATRELSLRFGTIAYVPSLAYRIAMVAAGEIEATFVKANSSDWDLAAADLLLEEAGGAILELDGTRPYYASPTSGHGSLVAGSGPLLPRLLGAARRHEELPPIA